MVKVLQNCFGQTHVCQEFATVEEAHAWVDENEEQFPESTFFVDGQVATSYLADDGDYDEEDYDRWEKEQLRFDVEEDF